jgi:antitoxin component of RelBE/YafQ-DinJ toxin-antitoxin module
MAKPKPEVELVVVSAQIPRPLKEQLDTVAEGLGMSLSAVIRGLLEAAIPQPKKRAR